MLPVLFRFDAAMGGHELRTLLSSVLVFVLIVPFWSGGPVSSGSFADQLVIDRFDVPPSDGEIPAGWYEYRFKKAKNPTKYTIVPFQSSALEETASYPQNHVLKAEADCGSSLIGKELTIDLREYPILSWRWKIGGLIEGADGRTKRGNDFPARIYVSVRPKEGFNPLRSLARNVTESVAGVPLPKATINFVWSSKYKAGETFVSPSSSKNQVVVVEGGETHAGKWVEAQVNVLEYYNQFFPGGPARVEGIAIMSDSDNTQSHVVAYYDDIMFRRAEMDTQTGL